VQACPFIVQAIWRAMLDLLHQGEPYGHLTINGCPVADAEAIARLIPGGPRVADVRLAVTMLEKHRVFDKTADGVIFCRRMVREEDLRQRRAAGGAKSLEHPNVQRPKRASEVAQKDTLPAVGRIPSVDTLTTPVKDTRKDTVEDPLKGSAPSFPPHPPNNPVHTHTARARGLGAGVMAGMLPRDHLSHAHCGRKCVPAFLHAEFVSAVGGDSATADERVRQFYGRTEAAIPADASIGEEPVRFWRARFRAAFTTPALAPDAARPSAVPGVDATRRLLDERERWSREAANA
jgi:hypothetical protein